MSARVTLCSSGDLREGEARGFVTGSGKSRRDIVIVRRAGVVRAYVNSCPHQGTPLETFPDRFLSADGTYLVCSTHGARFRIEDGTCVSGPCPGRALRALAVSEENGGLSVET